MKTYMEFQARDGVFVVAIEDIQAARHCGDYIQIWLEHRDVSFHLTFDEEISVSDMFDKLLNAIGKPRS